MIRSASVEFFRSARAFERSFEDTFHVGSFSSAIAISRAEGPPPQPSPASGRGGRKSPVRENLNQTKTLAHQHHVVAEFARPVKIRAVRLAPVGEAAIAFALVMREGRIDITVSAIADFGCLDHASGLAASVEHDPALAWRRCVRL